MRTEIKIGGYGGQGVILSGYIIGRAATIFDTKYATMMQAFGPEARGSACSAQIVVSAEPITYPVVTSPDVMILMSQEAFTRFSPELAPNGLLLTDASLVQPRNLRPDVTHLAIPATRIAEELGKRMVLNIVMMGFLSSTSSVTSPEAMRKAVAASVPKGTEEVNLRAYDKGWEFGREIGATLRPNQHAHAR